MIKLPEPVAYSYKLSTAVENGIYARFDRLRLELTPPAVHPDAVRELTKLHSESQLKQAVRDAYEDAAKVCDQQVNNANKGAETLKSNFARDICSAVAQTAHTSRMSIRALIKEIDA